RSRAATIDTITPSKYEVKDFFLQMNKELFGLQRDSDRFPHIRLSTYIDKTTLAVPNQKWYTQF
ncbi:hypothetical protein, partial [Polycladomyces subterraneus]